MIELTLVEGQTKDLEKLTDTEMTKSIKHFEKEVVTIKTGRANTAMVEDLKVPCYDSVMSLKELAILTAPDARLIVIQPWDKSIIGLIEAAISNSDLGVTPANDGNVIRIQLPQPNSARREELVKILHKKLEESKMAVRNSRKEFVNIIREHEHDKKISEDFSKRLMDILQKATDKYSAQLQQISDKKELEITTF